MQIAQTLSNFSASKADILRKAMGKKISRNGKTKKRFYRGAIKMEYLKIKLRIFFN